uniref:Uncharacterized protein n=1 Tax=Rhizophora mucronata TaxID=61149 RepID=A0A2P2NW77_RHIMU
MHMQTLINDFFIPGSRAYRTMKG